VNPGLNPGFDALRFGLRIGKNSPVLDSLDDYVEKDGKFLYNKRWNLDGIFFRRFLSKDPGTDL
jgi:hypothetical protein